MNEPVIDVRRDAVTIDREAGVKQLTRQRLRRELYRLVSAVVFARSRPTCRRCS